MCVKYQQLMIIILYPQSPWVLAPPEAGSSMTPVAPMETLRASQLLETPPSAASMPPVYSAMGGPLLAGSPQLESIPSIQQQQQQQQHDNVRAKSKLENVNVTRPTYFWLNI